MSKRLDILKNSLVKKEEKLNVKFENHFADVKSANGQPLNDKRNGAATMNRWENQRYSIRNAEKEVEKTERAIQKEESKIENVESVKDIIPPFILEMCEKGELTQWRKYPNMFFVKDVQKARIVFDKKTGKIYATHLNDLKAFQDADMWKRFAQCFNKMALIINNERKDS